MAAQPEPVLVAVGGGSTAVVPHEGTRVGEVTHLKDEVEGCGVAHAGDGALPAQKFLLSVFQR